MTPIVLFSMGSTKKADYFRNKYFPRIKNYCETKDPKYLDEKNVLFENFAKQYYSMNKNWISKFKNYSSKN